VFLANKRAQPAFDSWVEFVNNQTMLEKANNFYFGRKMQYVSRLSFDSLIINTLNMSQKKLQLGAIKDWYCKTLKQRVLLALKSSTYKHQRINNISNIINMKTDNTTLR
jgi:hypothetical protein